MKIYLVKNTQSHSSSRMMQCLIIPNSCDISRKVTKEEPYIAELIYHHLNQDFEIFILESTLKTPTLPIKSSRESTNIIIAFN